MAIPTIQEVTRGFEETIRRITEAELLEVQFRTEFTINVTLDTTDKVPGRVGQAEVVFAGGLLEGFKIEGFGIWERSRRDHRALHLRDVTVTYPARVHRQNGENISRAIFRAPSAETRQAMSSVIIEAFRIAARKELTHAQAL